MDKNQNGRKNNVDQNTEIFPKLCSQKCGLTNGSMAIDNKIPAKEIKNLKQFFSDSLNKGKLHKNKDVTYSRDTQQILSIPALHFNRDKKKFTLKIVDTKRVSTLKSLTPKRNVNNSWDKID